jgi:ribosomal protein L37E
MKALRRCSNCNSSVPEAAAFCPTCGSPLAQVETPTSAGSPAPPAEISCLRCGKKYSPPAPKFCMSCGFPVAQSGGPKTTVQPASPVSAEVDPEQPPGGLAAAEPAIQVAPAPGGSATAGWSPYQPAPGSAHIPGGLGEAAQKGKRLKGSAGRGKAFLPILARVAAVVLLVGIIAAGAWYGWTFWKSRSTGGATVEACSPIKPDDQYEEANRLDLEGDLRRDSYFASGQEYIIASGSTFRVPKGKTLIIEPGARVKFGEGSKMIVEGLLLACGGSNRRILFTANTTSGKPGYWAGLEIRNADPDTVLGHVNFEYGGRDYHAPLWIEGGTVHIEDLKFDANLWYPLSLDLNSYPAVRPPLVVENGPQGWEIRDGEMTSDQEWGNSQPYIIRELLTIAESGSLSIAPGTTVKFLPNGAINIKGDLTAIGTSSSPIRFTSYNDGGEEGSPDPKPGDWVGLRFFGRSGSFRLERVEIAYGGQTGYREVGCLWMQDANPDLLNISLSQCAGFAMSTDIASDPAIEKLSLDSKDIYSRWEIRKSDLEGNAEHSFHKWETTDGQPLIPVIQGWLRIAEDASLKILPGVALLFSQGDTGLIVEGGLQAEGERKQPITLTTVRDPAYTKAGGAEAGDWGGLHLANRGSKNQILRNLSISYAGGKSSPCLRLESASPNLKDVSIRNCASFAVSSDILSAPTIENLEINDNPQANLWEIRESILNSPNAVDWGPLVGSNKKPITRLITGFVTVEAEASLRLSPGLILKFSEGKGIKAKGALLVEGTKKDPVVMTSWRDPVTGSTDSNPQASDWGGILLDGSAGSQISYLEIRFAGSAANRVGCLNLVNSQPRIQDLTIRNCGYYPLTSDLASQPDMDNLLLEDNQPANEWAIRESQLPAGEQRTWTPISQMQSKDPVLRTVIGRITIDQGAGLSVAEEVVVKFTQGASLWVRGNISVLGTNRRPVILTSWRDSAYSREAGAEPGDWGGVVLEGAAADSILQGVKIRYAGGELTPRGGISLINAAPILKEVEITASAAYPLSLDATSNPVLDRISLSNNIPSNAVEVRSDRLEASGETVWSAWKDADGKPLVRVVNGILAIGPQASLRISPDTVIKFPEGAGLDVYGTLIANQAVLTSLYDDQYGGITAGGAGGSKVWQGVNLNGRTLVQLQDTLIRYAQIGLKMNNSSPLLSGVRIEDCWEAALGSDFLSEPELAGLSMSNNEINGILILDESLPEGLTRWEPIGEPNSQLVRVIRSPLSIGANSHFVIAPGVIVKFAQQAGLIVEGRLEAGQPGGEKVIFTALSDDTFGGNTDKSSNPVFRGAWTGLTLNPQNTSVIVSLNNAAIHYAMTGIDILNPISFQATQLSISGSQLYGMACGISLQLSLQDGEIDFQNNGQDIFGCIFEQLLEPIDASP